MNPYVYSGSKKILASVENTQGQNASFGSAVIELARSVFSASMSTSVAFAMVLFAATAVAGMSAIAYSEMSNGDFAPLSANHALTRRAGSPQVLGMATYGYNQPVCAKNTANCLNYELLSFSNGGWQVRVDYKLDRNVTGAIKVNNWPFMDGITNSGSGFTGNDLQPNQTYTFVLYRKVGSHLKQLTSLEITAPDSPIRPPKKPPICPLRPIRQDCTLDYSTDPCGVQVCPVPAYGYTSVNYSPIGGLVEGWLETLSSSINAPGKATVTGWAYNNGADLNLNIKFVNINTGLVYPASASIFGPYRGDVLSYVSGRLNSSPVSNNAMFTATANNLPAGSYYIVASYGGLNGNYGYPFNVSGQISSTFSIVPDPALSLRVLSPNGSEKIQTGTTFTINWQPPAGADTVVIALYKGSASGQNPGGCVNKLDGSYNLCGNKVDMKVGSYDLVRVPNTGTYEWAVSSQLPAGNDYYIAVGTHSIGDPSPGTHFINVDSSDQPFSIVSLPIQTGSVSVSLDPSSPVSRQVAMGSSDVTLGAYKFTETSGYQDVNVNGISFVATVTNNGKSLSNSGPGGTFQNFSLWVNGVQIGKVVGFYPGTTQNLSSNQYLISLSNLNLTVPKGSAATVILKADVNSWVLGAASNSTWTFGLGSGSAITAQGLNINISSGSGATSNSVTVVKTTITFASVASIIAPASATVSQIGNPSPGENMAIFAVSASPAGDVVVNSITLQQGGTALPGGMVSYSVYDASSGFSVPVGTGSIGASSGQIVLNLNSATAATGVTVGAGQTKYLVVTANTTAFGPSLSSSQATGTYSLVLTNWGWNDGSSSLNMSNDASSVVGSAKTYSLTTQPVQPSLVLSLDPATPVSSNIQAGATGVEVSRFKFSAVGSDMSISSLTVFVPTNSAYCPFTNFKLFDGATNAQVGSTVVYPTGPTCYATFNNLNYSISNANVKSLALRLDVLSNASAGTFNYGVASVSVPATSSGQNVILPTNNSPGNTMTIVPVSSQAVRVGQLINKNGTVYLVGNGGLYGIPSLDVFNSWGWNFGQLVIANEAEKAMSQIGLVPSRDPNCKTALDQIAGVCGSNLVSYDISGTVPAGTQNQSYKAVFSVANYSGSHYYSLSGTGAPAGLKFNVEYPVCPTGYACDQPLTNPLVLTGAPSEAGSFDLAVTAKDMTAGTSVTKHFTLVINGAVSSTACTINSFTATPSTINSGQSTQLAFSLSNCTDSNIKIFDNTNTYLGFNSPSPVTISPTATKTYVLSASNASSTAISQNVTVTVNPVQILSNVCPSGSVQTGTTNSIPANPICGPVTSTDTQRLGQIINKNGTVYLVGQNVLYGFPDLATFNSWGYTFGQIVAANSSEANLSQSGLVPMKSADCSSALDQINGKCPVSASNDVRIGQIINLNGTVYLVGKGGLYGFPDLATFNSWNFTFSQIVTANNAEASLPVFNSVVPIKMKGCNKPLDQISGLCSL